MSTERVLFERVGPIARITMNRDRKLNAIDGAMMEGLIRALERAESDPAVRAIILAGEGRAFSAGFDLGETYSAPPGEDATSAEIHRDYEFIMRFWDAGKPVIAEVKGACLGGAFELMLACDLCVASDDSRLGEPEVTFGSGVVAMLLPWFCGPRRSAELILRGEYQFAASDALTWGLVNRVVPAEQLTERTMAFAMEVARNDLHAVAHARQAMKDGYDKAGFRDAMAAAVSHCIKVEGEPSEEARAFHEHLEEEGLAAALAWRDRQLESVGDHAPEKQSEEEDP